MQHPLVSQLRFSRSEFRRALAGLSDEDAQRRILPMNCISWNIGHLAWQEQRYWLFRAQGIVLLPEINRLFANGAPACTPSLASAMDAWTQITGAADSWLEAVTNETLLGRPVVEGQPGPTYGDLMQRTIYHYWYHTGENAAIRQALGHSGLPQFVGNIDEEAPFRLL